MTRQEVFAALAASQGGWLQYSRARLLDMAEVLAAKYDDRVPPEVVAAVVSGGAR